MEETDYSIVDDIYSADRSLVIGIIDQRGNDAD